MTALRRCVNEDIHTRSSLVIIISHLHYLTQLHEIFKKTKKRLIVYEYVVLALIKIDCHRVGSNLEPYNPPLYGPPLLKLRRALQNSICEVIVKLAHLAQEVNRLSTYSLSTLFC